MNHLTRTLMILLPVLSFVGGVLSEEREPRRGYEGHDRVKWQGEIGRFHEHDLALWRNGRWYHGRHEGRLGWWWIVGGAWYFYPARIEPYPDPFHPPTLAGAAPAGPSQYWYYCARPAGYYPYVAQCSGEWLRVAAITPPVGTPR